MKKTKEQINMELQQVIESFKEASKELSPTTTGFPRKIGKCLNELKNIDGLKDNPLADRAQEILDAEREAVKAEVEFNNKMYDLKSKMGIL